MKTTKSATKNLRSRILAAMISMVLAVGLLPASAFAVDGGSKLAASGLAVGAQASGYYVYLATEDDERGLVSYDLRSSAYNGSDGPGTSFLFTTSQQDVTLTVTAIPNAAWEFTGWYDGASLVCIDEEYIFKLKHDMNLVARFEPRVPGVAISGRHFPDDKFRAFVKANYDTDGDDWLAKSESERVTSMKCTHKGIISIQGIEHFTNLTALNVSNNSIVSVDLSKNKALEEFAAGTNQIASIDLSENKALEKLNLDTNDLATIDASMLPSLTKLLVYNNHLSALDVSGNPQLSNLECYGNAFEQIDLGSNDLLKQAVLNGAKDDSSPDYDKYSATVDGKSINLRVGKNVNLTLGTTDPDPSSNPGSGDNTGSGTNPNPSSNADPASTPGTTPSPSHKADASAATKKASSIELVTQKTPFTGKAVTYTEKVTRTGSTGNVSFSYFKDAACMQRIAAANVRKAGTYYVRATVAADANHHAATSKAAQLVITKAKNTLSVKGKKAAASAQKLTKKAQVIKKTRAFKVKKAKGKVTFRKMRGTKMISVTKVGNLKVKKGTPKGTYTLKVKATAKGNANYKKLSKAVTLKVVVR